MASFPALKRRARIKSRSAAGVSNLEIPNHFTDLHVSNLKIPDHIPNPIGFISDWFHLLAHCASERERDAVNQSPSDVGQRDAPESPAIESILASPPRLLRVLRASAAPSTST